MTQVLIAEDNIISARIMEKNIKDWGFCAVMTKDGKEAWTRLRQNPNDIQIIILDWMMPRVSGIEICRRLRRVQDKTGHYFYIIMVTARDERRDMIEGLLAGADDYITKPLDLLELKARLMIGRRIITLQTKLMELASQDSLTQLLNHKSILGHIEEELDRSAREGHPLGLILLDIDFFKKINDTHGHTVGDQVLVEISSRLKNSIRKYERAGRYGGDELLVVATNCDWDKVKKVSERLKHAVCSRKIMTDAGPIKVNMSLGGLSSASRPHAGVKILLRACDRALYRAKEKGRNCCVVVP
jgi:two-component system cell cycle response regulator